MRAFITVGSTKFDSLVQAVLSQPVIHALRSKGYLKLVIQCGNSHIEGFADSDTSWSFETHRLDPLWSIEVRRVEIEMWRFKPSLEEDYDAADLVISHAGSGTILDVLRRGKPLIVVPNPTLLDNHQEELADALSTLGHLKASTVSDLSQTVLDFDASILAPFPQFDGSRFRGFLDQEMGYV